MNRSVQSATAAALRGETPADGFSGPIVHPLLTGILARQAGVELLAREAPDEITAST